MSLTCRTGQVSDFTPRHRANTLPPGATGYGRVHPRYTPWFVVDSADDVGAVNGRSARAFLKDEPSVLQLLPKLRFALVRQVLRDVEEFHQEVANGMRSELRRWMVGTL